MKNMSNHVLGNRRCLTGESCGLGQASSRVAFLDLPVVDLLARPKKDWELFVSSVRQRGRTAAHTINIDWTQYPPEEFLFSHCFTDGNLVLMEDGTEKPIEKVVVGDNVVTHKGSIKKVTATSRRPYTGELLKLDCTGIPQYTTVTPEHPFSAVFKDKTCACGCGEKVRWEYGFRFVLGHQNKVYGRPQDSLYDKKRTDFEESRNRFVWTKAGELERGNSLQFGYIKETHDLDWFTEKHARLLGYYLAEGWVSKELNKNCSDYGILKIASFAFSGDEEKSYVAEVVELIRELYGVSVNITDRRPDSNCLVLDSRSSALCDFLLKYGGSKAGSKKLHSEVLLLPTEKQRHVLACWYRGDGGGTISRDMAGQLRIIALRCGIHVNFFEHDESTAKDGVHHKKSYTLQLRPTFMRLNAEEFGTDWKSRSATNRMVDSQVDGWMISYVRKVTSEQVVGIFVNNFSVEDDESYVINGVAVHNCSIVSSVATDETKYRILAPTDELVNINGNAWTNHVIPNCFRSFVGGENYHEHVQVKAKSKGKILDAVLRPVSYVGKDGKSKADVYYVDILIATARKHGDIVSRVESGQLNTLSMGAIANQCQCSFCGKITDENTPNCFHLDNSIRQYLRASDGRKYIVSELCGAVDKAGNYIEGSCQFIEASWVDNPAFAGAVVNYLIDLPKQPSARAAVAVEAPDFPEIWFNPANLASLKVADISTMIAIRLAVKQLRASRYNQIAAKITADFSG